MSFEFADSSFASCRRFAVSGVGLGEASFGAGDLLLHLVCGAPDLLVYAEEDFGERDFDVLGDAFDFGKPFGAYFVEEGRQGALV